jgi:hypothetical protein
VTAAVPAILAPIFLSMRGFSEPGLILFAAMSELTAMDFLCAYYLTWAARFSTFTAGAPLLHYSSQPEPVLSLKLHETA